MTFTITAFERAPDGGKGLVRDRRVRRTLEKVGQPYQVRLISFCALLEEPAHRVLHPFGEIPTYEERLPLVEDRVRDRLNILISPPMSTMEKPGPPSRGFRRAIGAFYRQAGDTAGR